MKKILVYVALLFTAMNIFAEVKFGGLDLNSQDKLLFTAYQNIPGTPAYTSLLSAKLTRTSVKDSPVMLTCFPERLELINGGTNLQIRNRYGRALYNESLNTLIWTSTANRIPVEYTHMGPQAVSPDGKWICFVRRTRSSVGQLVLQNAKTTEEKILVDVTDFSYDDVKVKWSPDSSAVLYENKGTVYFATPTAGNLGMNLPEAYCKIGKGTIESVNWTDEKALIYIDGDIIYKIYENELYTRGLYSSLIGNGTIIGRLPTVFNPLHDKFSCDNFCSQLIIISGEKTLSWYKLPVHGYEMAGVNGIYPITDNAGSILNSIVFWTTEGKPVVWSEMVLYENGIKASSVYSISNKLDLILTVKGSLKPQLSPDKRHLAFTGGNSIYIYDTTTWKQTAKSTGEKIISFVWKDKQSLYLGGLQTVRLWSFDAKASAAASIAKEESVSSPGVTKVLFLSSVHSAFWFKNQIIAYTSKDGKCYLYNEEKNVWTELEKQIPYPVNLMVQNGKFRVFTDTAQNLLYANAVYVRSLQGKVLTYSLYADTDKTVPEQKKVCIVFDAMDSAEGVPQILSVLEDFNIRGTFFINGEFIRRYPNEVKMIASKNQECASSFYSTADLFDEGIVVNADFIKRGLARNEDEFFTTTGKELSLLWHAPYYHANDLMKEAGAAAGYRYVKAYTGYSDRVTMEMYEKDPAYLYLDAGNLIDALVSSLEDGMILPVLTGKVYGTRKDYLYEKIDLLIAAVLDHGYSIVDVRSIIK